jgi:hypothetical protein
MEPKNNLDWEKLLRDQVAGAPKIVWNDSMPRTYTLCYKMKPEDIMTFVSGLHTVQLDMIDCAVIAKEREGFPEANLAIKHIMEKK